VVATVLVLAIATPSEARPFGGATLGERETRELADRVDRARRDALDETFQAELPRYHEDATAGQAGSSAWPRRRAGGDLPRQRPRMVDAREHDEQGGVSGLLYMLMWGMVIVVIVLVLAWIVAEMFKYGGDAELPPHSEPEARGQAIVDAIIDRPLGDADELARRGLFVDAIHTLLLRTLQELARSAAVRVAPATTSREILARVPLLADAREALAGLITAVEITHFGDEPASIADYDRCRQQFHVFAQALRSPGQLAPRAVAA
jgi:Domain of unknown function (DUF4129)